MGCSCNKNKRQGSRSSTTPPRTPMNNRIGSAVRRPAAPASVQSLNAQMNINPSGISAEKRRLQTERRQVIKNRMNRKQS